MKDILGAFDFDRLQSPLGGDQTAEHKHPDGSHVLVGQQEAGFLSLSDPQEVWARGHSA